MSHVDKILKHYQKLPIARKSPLMFRTVERLKVLLEGYTNKTASFQGKGCPLCRIAHGCSFCPWTIFNPSGDGGCYSYGFLIADEGTRLARMKQIRRWIASYEEALRRI